MAEDEALAAQAAALGEGQRAIEEGRPVIYIHGRPYPDPGAEAPDFDTLEARRMADIRRTARIAEKLNGPGLIALAVSLCHSQAEVARMSGITENTLTALKQGKRPSPAQRAALMWGMARTLGL